MTRGPVLRSIWRPSVSVAAASVLLGGSLVCLAPTAASAAGSPCADGSTPDLLSTVTCTTAGAYTLTVPAGTASVDVDIVGGGGGAGYPARQHIGGNAAEVTGTLTLPAGTAYLYVIVGAGGTGDNHGTSTGGGGSAVVAQDAGHALLAKLAIAGGGGGGAYNGDGGDAGSPGTSDNAQAVSGPGGAGAGSTGGAGGTGNYAPGTAGGNDNPLTLTVAAGGNGGAVPGGATGGGGAGGYGGGGGGGGSRGSILSSNVAGGGGGSSLASAYLGSASIAVLPGTGGVQLPGLVASDGATGVVTLTFDGLAVPGAPTGAVATAGDGQASVAFTAPATGSPITSYTVTSSPGGLTATCPGSPCVIAGLSNGTSYTFTVHATNAAGDSPESTASAAATPAGPPGVPADVSITTTASTLVVSFVPPNDNGSPITDYQVSTDGGAHWTTVPTTVSGARLSATLTALTPGTSYAVLVRAVNDVDAGQATTPVSAVTLPAALAAPTATAGVASATVAWTASTSSTVTGYTVTALPGPATCTTTTATSCVIGGTAGVSYTYTVVAHSPAGDSDASAPSSSVVVAPPVVPASVPTGVATTLTTTQGTLTTAIASQQITVVGTGFLADSSVAVIGYSSPVVLASVVTNAAGNFSATVTLPADLAAGNHTLIASGVGADGVVRQIQMPFSVAGVTSASASAGSSNLPRTGTPVSQLGFWGLLTVGGGLALLAAGRRRSCELRRW